MKSIFNSREKEILSLLLVFSGALFLRVYELGMVYPGLFNDELIYLFSGFLQMHFKSSLFSAPGYNIYEYYNYMINLTIPAIHIFGPSTISARIGVSVYGSLIVFPLYYITKRITKSEVTSLISSILWGISPSAIVTSRVGFGIEIEPLFFYLIAIYFLILFYIEKRMRYFYFFILSTLLLTSLSSGLLYGILPTFFAFIYVITLLIIDRIDKFNSGFQKIKFFLPLITANVVTWYALKAFYLTGSSLLPYLLRNSAPYQYILISKPFFISFNDFLIRFLYSISPYKIVWLNEFTSFGLNYPTPVLVPFIYLFEFPFLIIFFVLFILNKLSTSRKLLSMIIFFCFSGFLVPMFNLLNPVSYFEPSEGIFALPFMIIMISISITYIFAYLKNYQKRNLSSKVAIGNSAAVKNKTILSHPASIFVIVMVLVATIGIGNLSQDLYNNSYYENSNSSLYYSFYGWDHTAKFIEQHDLEKYPLYYIFPTVGFVNSTNANFWFYTMHYPIEWLYTFSNGKIKNMNLLNANSLPTNDRNGAIVLTQNNNYISFLNNNSVKFTILRQINRENGSPAISIIYITDNLSGPALYNLYLSNILDTGNISQSQTINLSEMSTIKNAFSVSISFTISHNFIPNQYLTLITTTTPTFSLGLWPESDLGGSHNYNNTYWPESAIYSNTGNYLNISNSWVRLWTSESIKYNISYTLFLTYNNGTINFYLNNTDIASYILPYAIYPFSNVLVVDPNIDANISHLFMWNTSLNSGQINFVYYHQYNISY